MGQKSGREQEPMRGQLNMGMDMARYRSLGGCGSLEGQELWRGHAPGRVQEPVVQALENGNRPGMRQEHGRGLKTGAREGTEAWDGTEQELGRGQEY